MCKQLHIFEEMFGYMVCCFYICVISYIFNYTNKRYGIF